MRHNWEYKRLGEVCSFIGGGTPSKSNGVYYSGNIPWATVRDMVDYELTSTELKITPEAISETATNLLPKGMIVISTHVGLGKICELMQDTAINQDLKGISFSDQSVNKHYFVQWYRSIAEYIKENGRGATVKGVTLDFMRNLSIPVPPMVVQKQIVVELDKINEIISDCKEAIRNLDSLAQSLFYDFFGDPITNPKGWKTLPFDECIYKIKYPIKLQTKDYRDVGLYPIISQEETLISGYTDLEECVYYVKRPVLIFGDHTRIVKYVPFSFALGADGVKILNPVDSIQVKYFYFCLLLFKIPSLGYSRHYRLLKKKEIPVPPMALQVKFAARIEQIEQQKKYLEDTIANMQTLLNSRMDYWFN